MQVICNCTAPPSAPYPPPSDLGAPSASYSSTVDVALRAVVAEYSRLDPGATPAAELRRPRPANADSLTTFVYHAYGIILDRLLNQRQTDVVAIYDELARKIMGGAFQHDRNARLLVFMMLRNGKLQ